MNATGFATLGLLLAFVLFAPKRWALLGLVGGVLYMTLGQSIDLLGLHLYAIRVLALGAFVRVLIRGEWSFTAVNDVDKALVLAYGYRTVVFILNGNGSLTLGLGHIVDVTLSYFACRGLLSNFEDLKWFLRGLALLLVPYAAILSIESSTGHNPFVAIGGMDVYAVRGGRPRGAGSFAHALTLGTFGASFVPLYFALCLIRKWRLWGAMGLLLCFALVFFSNSSGPFLCVLAALIGWLFWFLRENMSAVRISVVVSLLILGLTMNAPIWFLPARISELIGSGDGWHRSYLVDIALQHFSEWWLVGMPAPETSSWFPYIVVTGGADLVNYYLDFGIAAGVAAIGFFLFLLVRAFSRVGRASRALRLLRSSPAIADEREFWLWALGVTLAIHVVNWLSLVYFDQYYVIFFMQLAALSTLSQRSIHAYRRHHQAQLRNRPAHAPSHPLAPPRL